ncbi:thiamine kinase [Hartmannibacter diazotrophicus]|uniref:Thiamine kinase n=1 Tax=Hartmannibacter diazotrophicus TaxID=1482074 RepID=A0A2C9D8Y7_9HYPH|nr:choline kinase family protein [Hartmannibacter diazotrophicus]SON56630.1 thiamine kinase [Hartmannibacter diazotrophicus]
MWKSMGEAMTESEKSIEAILSSVPRWQGETLRYQAVSGGLSNTNWRIAAGGGDYFLKVPGRGTDMFISRDAANEASRRAHASGFGVEVVDFLAEHGVEIFAFADGYRASSNLDFLRPVVRNNAVKALRAFNDAPRLTLTKTVFDMIDEHYEQLRMVGGRKPQDSAHIHRCLEEARQAIAASGFDLVPCMNDTLAGNFLINDEDDVILVDFEYASNNERVYELALWFTEMAFPLSIERELVETYFGCVDRSIEARIAVLRALADLKWFLWAMIQEVISTLDFDYYKYGTWKLMRARKQFYHPDWSIWLKDI